MATLIAVYSAQGCVGRCDARCYEAVSAMCDCVCGGRNHGVGLAAAAVNTRDQAAIWVKDFAQQRGFVSVHSEINRSLVDQFSLFDLDRFAESVA